MPDPSVYSTSTNKSYNNECYCYQIHVSTLSAPGHSMWKMSVLLIRRKKKKKSIKYIILCTPIMHLYKVGVFKRRRKEKKRKKKRKESKGRVRVRVLITWINSLHERGKM